MITHHLKVHSHLISLKIVNSAPDRSIDNPTAWQAVSTFCWHQIFCGDDFLWMVVALACRHFLHQTVYFLNNPCEAFFFFRTGRFVWLRSSGRPLARYCCHYTTRTNCVQTRGRSPLRWHRQLANVLPSFFLTQRSTATASAWKHGPEAEPVTGGVLYTRKEDQRAIQPL